MFLIAGAGCQSGPVDTSELGGQEAALAAEGNQAMRAEDGTTGDPALARLGGAPPEDPFDPDPFIARERIDREADLDESSMAPGAETLIPGPESTGLEPGAQPAVNVQDE